MAETAEPRTESLIKRLTLLYLSALASIALLTIVGQVVVQKAILQLEGDSCIVNIAGRQRMLSQRLTRLTFELEHAKNRMQTDTATQIDLSTKIRTDLDTWTQNHRGLQLGSEALQLPGDNSEPVQMQFNELTPHFEALRVIMRSEVTQSSTEQPETLDAANRYKMNFHSDAFLAGMDKIVTLFEQEARARVNRLRWIETALLIATIVVLTCEGLFVFSPAVASLSRSLTKLHSTSDELEKAKDSAERANNAKTDFLARVSHELRTPLHAILGMLGLVEQTKLKLDQRNKIQLANEASASLLSLVDDLLDVASIEQGREFVIHPQLVSLPRLLKSVSEMMHPLALAKGLQFELNLDESLPNWVTTDADRVRQVVSNLLQNAIRYTESGVVRFDATVETAATSSILHIAIEDTGIGISTCDRARIFASFDRGSNTERSTVFGRRLGLGLAIAQAIVKNLGGKIALESEVGQGSRFTVTLPIQVGTENANGEALSKGQISFLPLTTKTANGSKPTALIVDDSPTNLLVMRSQLRQLGYRTMSASSLAESIDKFQRHRFDIVLLDRNLADGDGLNFPQILTGVHEFAPLDSSRVFLITADIQLTTNSDPRLRHFDRVLYKPISLAELRVAIATQSLCSNSSVDRADEGGSAFEKLKRKLAKGVLDALPDEINAMRGMLNQCDFAGLEFVAHRLIGSTGNAGLLEAAELSKQLDDAAANRDRTQIEAFLSQLEKFSESRSLATLPLGGGST